VSEYIPHTVLAKGVPWPRDNASLNEMRQDLVNGLLKRRPMTLQELMASTGIGRSTGFRLTEHAERAKSTSIPMYYWLPDTPYDPSVPVIEYQVMWWLRQHPWSEIRKMPDSLGRSTSVYTLLQRAELAGKVQRKAVKGKNSYKWKWIS